VLNHAAQLKRRDEDDRRRVTLNEQWWWLGAEVARDILYISIV
jgi:hypothetical protein